MTYRDAILTDTTSSNRKDADPRVLVNAERKSRQVLIGYSSIDDNATIGTSLFDLTDKANKIILELDSPTRPLVAHVHSISRTRDSSLLLMLNSKEAADWLREPDVEAKFVDKFAIGACIRDRNFNLFIRWVPITLDPNNRKHHREIEEANGLPPHSIQKLRWIKPIIRRRAGQTRAHATISLATADTANRIIRDGLVIFGVKIRAEKTKMEPLQCLKCRGWGHKAQACEAQVDTCGTCGEDHRTSSCPNAGKTYCASCKSDAHASWDRSCPEFIRRCEVYDNNYPENIMVYFPSDQDWMLTTKPDRIPVSEKFPKRFAVNSLPITNRNPRKPAAQSSSRKPATPQQSTTRERQHMDDTAENILSRSQPNLVPLGRGREEGELSDQADKDSLLDHQDTANVEEVLNGLAWEVDLPGSWNPDNLPPNPS